jgi:hypothetical protein
LVTLNGAEVLALLGKEMVQVKVVVLYMAGLVVARAEERVLEELLELEEMAVETHMVSALLVVRAAVELPELLDQCNLMVQVLVEAVVVMFSMDGDMTAVLAVLMEAVVVVAAQHKPQQQALVA